MSWDCFGTLCLAMTKGGCLAMIAPFVIASEAWQTGSLKIRRISRVKSHRWCAA